MVAGRLGVQLISEEKELEFNFDFLDCTKRVPEELAPMIWVGTMTLNKVRPLPR